jgi:hypothetical protein
MSGVGNGQPLREALRVVLTPGVKGKAEALGAKLRAAEEAGDAGAARAAGIIAGIVLGDQGRRA